MKYFQSSLELKNLANHPVIGELYEKINLGRFWNFSFSGVLTIDEMPGLETLDFNRA